MPNSFVTEASSTVSPWITSTQENINPFDCTSFCENDGICTLTGPGLTAVCSCGSNFRGRYCEELVLWFEFFVKDSKLTGTGAAALFCIAVSLAILSFAGVIVYRRYTYRKSKAREKESYQQSATSPHFDELASRQELVIYQVAQPPRHSLSPPRGYIPTTSSPADSWQDFHNPGYRQSYIDTVI